MSITRHHAEWLSLVEVSGPFLSMPVLLRVFPQGLDAHDPEISKAVRRSLEQWQDNQQGLRPDPAVHTGWVRFVLRDVLGFPNELLQTGPAIPESLKATVAEHGETLRPDLVIQRQGQPPRVLVQVVPPTQDLDKPLKDHRWKASPGTRMAELLRGAGVRLGLLTNGERWMLVHAQPGETAGFASVRLPLAGGAHRPPGLPLPPERGAPLRPGRRPGGPAHRERREPAGGHRPARLPGA